MEEKILLKKKEVLDEIKARVSENKISNYRLHKTTGLSQSSISRYFNNKSEMSLDSFIRICDALNLKIYLIPEENITNEFESLMNPV